MTDHPALDAFRAHLDAHAGRLAEADAPLALAALREYVAGGAQLGRALRDDLTRFKPADDVGRMLCWLYVVTIDAATHSGREGALVAHAATDQPLAKEAGELLALLGTHVTGPRPVVSKRTDGKGCGA